MNDEEIMYRLLLIAKHAEEAIQLVQDNKTSNQEFINELDKMDEPLSQLRDEFGMMP